MVLAMAAIAVDVTKAAFPFHPLSGPKAHYVISVGDLEVQAETMEDAARLFAAPPTYRRFSRRSRGCHAVGGGIGER